MFLVFMATQSRQRDEKVYKQPDTILFSSFRAVSMIPGDRKVAGCFYFSKFCEDL